MKRFLFSALCLLGLTHEAPCQTDIYEPERNLDLWSADTLFIGAGFSRLDYKPVKIWLKENEAGLEGQLFYIDPATGKELFLFGNHEDPGRVITLSDMVDVPVGQTLTFVYKVVGKGRWDRNLDDFGEIRVPKYTGPNRRGKPYYTSVSSDVNKDPGKRYGHRWSVAGRISKDVLEFGFEDDSTPDSDMDFDDIVFGVDGLTLVNFERTAKLRSYVW
ncbi:MAG: hypothetical protein JWP91_265 [Fibrobacteres bacterium]|nr:hypothetical protein [Fibrobacterota bacterium]